MKVCILCNEGSPTDTPPSLGGVQIASYSLAKELVALKCEVHIITCSNNQRSIRDSNGIYIHYIDRRDATKWVRSQLHLLRYNLRVFCKIQEIQPDIIHCQHIYQIHVAYFAKKCYHIPYIIQIHGDIGNNIFPLILPFIDKYTRDYRFYPSIRSAEYFICLTQDAKNKVDLKFRRETIIIPNGVDKNIFHPNQIHNSIITQNLKLICVSRLAPKKGLEDAILSMKYIIQTDPLAILYIVGDGISYNQLVAISKKSNLSEHIIFIGSASQLDVAKYYQMSTIFLLPSLSEGLPLTLLEACASGLPVILTPFSGAEQFIEKYGNGYIVPIHDPEEIANAARQIWCDPSTYTDMRKKSLSAASEYSWENIAKIFLSLYQKILIK